MEQQSFQQAQNHSGWSPARRAKAGKASLNRALAALGIAAAGYLFGFLIPLASSGNSTTGHMVFFPIGGIFSLFLAVSAIMIGTKVRRAIGALPDERRERISPYVDLERQRTYATIGVAIGIVSIIANPLIGFLLYSVLR